jgi:ABC-2 type transport system ATP-binding protein/lipopolysaccharide transport system ATP-binding protein
MAAAIVTEGLGKRYLLGERADAYGTLRAALGGLVERRARSRREELWALRGVDLVVEQGEVVGVVGRNGAGKTTLLKLVARITEPTEGVARMRGRVGALLEVGTGFHFELTGRENIFFNGAVLGMSRREIERRFDEIVEFSGVERFLDTPLKRYSAGMYLRLAFSVAAHLEPDIVIVDEVLAVGDAEFQRRCISRMSELTHEGRTVLFVSHDLGAIGRLCDRVIWIEHGRIHGDGRAAELLERYQRSAEAGLEPHAMTRLELDPRASAGFVSAHLTDADGQAVATARRDEPVTVQLGFVVREPVSGLRLGLSLVDRRGIVVLDDARAAAAAPPGTYRATVTLPAIIAAGDYLLRGRIEDGSGMIEQADLLELRLRPRVDQRHVELVRSRLLQPGVRWDVEELGADTSASQ